MNLNNGDNNQIKLTSYYKVAAKTTTKIKVDDKARQGKFIYIAHFIHNGNSKCFTWKKLK